MEKFEIRRARQIWSENKDANKAFLCLHNINCIEKYLLKGLAHSDKNDYLRAFQNVIILIGNVLLGSCLLNRVYILVAEKHAADVFARVSELHLE